MFPNNNILMFSMNILGDSIRYDSMTTKNRGLSYRMSHPFMFNKKDAEKLQKVNNEVKQGHF